MRMHVSKRTNLLLYGLITLVALSLVFFMRGLVFTKQPSFLPSIHIWMADVRDGMIVSMVDVMGATGEAGYVQRIAYSNIEYRTFQDGKLSAEEYSQLWDVVKELPLWRAEQKGTTDVPSSFVVCGLMGDGVEHVFIAPESLANSNEDWQEFRNVLDASLRNVPFTEYPHGRTSEYESLDRRRIWAFVERCNGQAR